MGFWRVQEIYGLGCFWGVIVSIASRGKYHVANCTLPTHSLPIFVGTSWTRIGNPETLAAVLSGFPPPCSVLHHFESLGDRERERND